MQKEVETLEKIYSGLKQYRGSILELSRRAKVTTQYINMVLNGKQNDDEVVLEASKLWKELEQKRSAVRSEISANVDEAQQLSSLQPA